MGKDFHIKARSLQLPCIFGTYQRKKTYTYFINPQEIKLTENGQISSSVYDKVFFFFCTGKSTKWQCASFDLKGLFSKFREMWGEKFLKRCIKMTEHEINQTFDRKPTSRRHHFGKILKAKVLRISMFYTKFLKLCSRRKRVQWFLLGC